MQNDPDHQAKRTRLIRICGGFAIALTFAACVAVYLLPSRADLAAERRLLGKWGVWIEGSDMTLPTQRIVEWLPNGQTAHYSPTMEPWGTSTEDDNRSSDWRIRAGKLLVEMQAPQLQGGIANQECQLDWQNDNTLTMRTDVGNGTHVNVVYKRILPDTQQIKRSGRTM